MPLRLASLHSLFQVTLHKGGVDLSSKGLEGAESTLSLVSSKLSSILGGSTTSLRKGSKTDEDREKLIQLI